MTDDESARRKRARALHDRMAEISRQVPSSAGAEEPDRSEKPEQHRPPGAVPNPRDFIHRKMREQRKNDSAQG